MATVTLAALVAVLVAVLVWQNRHRLSRRPVSPGRMVDCVVCGRTVPVVDAVVVAEVPDDAEEAKLAAMGGTVCVAEYCSDHAPETYRGR